MYISTVCSFSCEPEIYRFKTQYFSHSYFILEQLEQPLQQILLGLQYSALVEEANHCLCGVLAGTGDTNTEGKTKPFYMKTASNGMTQPFGLGMSWRSGWHPRPALIESLRMARFTRNIHSGYFKERFPNSATCTRTFTSKNDSAANSSALSRQWDPSQNGLFFFSIDLERKAYPERCSSSWKEQRTTAHCSPYRSSLLRTFVYRTLRYLVLVRKLSVLATVQMKQFQNFLPAVWFQCSCYLSDHRIIQSQS